MTTVRKKQLMAFAVVAVFAMTCLSAALITSDETDADTSFTITDYVKGERTFSEPAQNVVTIGKAFTITTISLGQIEKLSAVDTSSKDDVQELSGKSILSYDTSMDGFINLRQGLDILVAQGKWIKEKDMIITYGYGFYEPRVSLLTEGGYTVVQFYPNDYDSTVAAIADIEKILGVPDSMKRSQNMIDVKESVTNKIEGLSGEKVSAIYAGFSSTSLTIANTGITDNLITTAGGTNAGRDAGVTAASYAPGDGFIELKKAEGATVIFLDGNYNGSAEDFKDIFNVLDGYRILKLDQSWNSYSPAFAFGLVALYEFMYESDTSPTEGSDNSNMLYAALGVIAVIAVLAAIVIFRRQ